MSKVGQPLRRSTGKLTNSLLRLRVYIPTSAPPLLQALCFMGTPLRATAHHRLTLTMTKGSHRCPPHTNTDNGSYRCPPQALTLTMTKGSHRCPPQALSLTLTKGTHCCPPQALTLTTTKGTHCCPPQALTLAMTKGTHRPKAAHCTIPYYRSDKQPQKHCDHVHYKRREKKSHSQRRRVTGQNTAATSNVLQIPTETDKTKELQVKSC